MEKLYTTPAAPGSFSGLSIFKRSHKFKNYSALKTLDPYNLHKQTIKKFPRKKTIAKHIDEYWQTDLIDLKKYHTKNKYYKFLLVVIDVLSRYAWVQPLKNKESKSCREAFEKIFSESERIPKYIYSDLGNEFKGECKKFLDQKGIIQLESESLHKASIVERFNRTLKNKISRYFTYTGKESYINVLQDFVKSYNNTYHSSIKTKPSMVNEKNSNKIKYELYGEDIDDVENIKDYNTIRSHMINFKFKLNDYVRVINDKKVFEKGYTQNWSKEIYLINQLNPTNPPTYKIKSLTGKKYSWNYYSNELQLIPNIDTFEILKESNDKTVVRDILNKDKLMTISSNQIV